MFAPAMPLKESVMQRTTIRKNYSSRELLQIEVMGPLLVAVANRWIMGWPDRVAALFAAGTYFDCLASQVARERTVLADEANMRHLARHEILQIHEIREDPPW